jgi:ectoine hydroxylase-related dioxygenase (phytanoyl-CoA dioxygenase family)
MTFEATVEVTQPKGYERYRVSVQEYVTFREQGFLAVRGLVPSADVDELNGHMDDLIAGRAAISQEAFSAFKASYPKKPEDWLRVHMLHRISPIHERFLLHPRVLDVLEAIIGPDVLALQTMLFFKQPGQPGQGYHQDSYYIPTLPDTLCGAWLALTRADEANGCLWFTIGSQNEPIYPDTGGQAIDRHSNIGDIGSISGASEEDVERNTLSRIAGKYSGREVKVEAEPGDVVFFGGHVLHRSHMNRATYPRRSFVAHYCNARSYVPWNHGMPYEGNSANYLHILARGETHLPYAQPKFGTLCAANAPQATHRSGAPMGMMGDDDGMMEPAEHGDPNHA